MVKQLSLTELSMQELQLVVGGDGSSDFWRGVGKELGIIWAAAGDAGYCRAHKYGGPGLSLLLPNTEKIGGIP